jgi:hypothetical protein
MLNFQRPDESEVAFRGRILAANSTLLLMIILTRLVSKEAASAVPRDFNRTHTCDQHPLLRFAVSYSRSKSPEEERS